MHGLLNQACTGYWFLEITFLYEVSIPACVCACVHACVCVCVCMCVCVCVCLPSNYSREMKPKMEHFSYESGHAIGG